MVLCECMLLSCSVLYPSSWQSISTKAGRVFISCCFSSFSIKDICHERRGRCVLRSVRVRFGTASFMSTSLLIPGDVAWCWSLYSLVSSFCVDETSQLHSFVHSCALYHMPCSWCFNYRLLHTTGFLLVFNPIPPSSLKTSSMSRLWQEIMY